MTPIPKALLAKFATYPTPSTATKRTSEKRGHDYKITSWAAEALVYWPDNKDITASSMAMKTGRTEVQCAKQLTCAATNGIVRRVALPDSGRSARIWERTKIKQMGPTNAHVERIVAMPAGKRFVASELWLADSSRSRTIRQAREMGLIRPVGVEAPKRATYRKVK